MASEQGKNTFFTRYWWIFAGALGAVALSTALNITNTDGWIMVSNPSNDTYVINWNTTKPSICTVGNYSRWTGTGFVCSPDTTGSGSGSDGNNYTTGIAFTGTTSKLLTLTRSGMADLTASFSDLFQNFTTEINSLNSTKLNVTDQRYNDTAAIASISTFTQTKASTGTIDCGSNFLQVLTINNGSWSTTCTAAGSSSTPPVKFVNLVAGAVTDTNQPLAERAFGATYYMVKTNLSEYTEFRFGMSRAATNGAAAAVVFPKYRNGSCNTLTATSWTNLSTSNPDLSSTTANQAIASDYYSLVDTSKDDVCIAFFTQGGDGVLDPQYRNLWMEFK